ncbi:hypothetical protein [Streptomyces zaomyceticus]|uniref:hypothetical protein n=1 Tax=Streptomyces zaomyceticus TaxID=68286 RepID=UPI002E251917
MTPPVTAPALPASPVLTLAQDVAARLPMRAGAAWTVEPYRAWWTARHPAARLVHGRRALVLVARPWDTQIGWQLPDREPYQPDVTLPNLAPIPIAHEVLRQVLPVLDDQAAATVTDATRARHVLLAEIGAAIRAQGVATYERAGLLVNTGTVTWSAGGVRYSATLHGSNPVCDVQLTGPVHAVERAATRFLPTAYAGQKPRFPIDGIRGRLPRRVAAYLAPYTAVSQTEQGGLAFGPEKGPYGYVAPAADPLARVQNTTPVSVDVHGVGVDLLLSLAPHLTVDPRVRPADRHKGRTLPPGRTTP